MRDTVSCLLGIDFSSSRRSGNSTRAIDKAIQIIFEGLICKVEDPWMYGEGRQVNENLFGRILDRLAYEHHLTPTKGLNTDRHKLTIELL